MPIVYRVQKRMHPKHKSGLPAVLKIFAILLIALFLCFNVVTYSYRQRHRFHNNSHLRVASPNHDMNVWVPPNALAFDPALAAAATHLVLVAGHSVTISGHLADADRDEHDWYLMEYQVGHGLPQAIVAHIQAGIDAAAAAAVNDKALLIFSGGATRRQTGPDTEGTSYYRVADAMQLWTTNINNNNVRARTLTEEFATDSFENLLFSIARFYEVTHRYPDHITIVSFTFKQQRFVQQHAAALRYPLHRITYRGVDPPASSGFDLVAATQGEEQNARTPFVSDPYGCHSQVLQDKRQSRNPFCRTPPYRLSCPALRDLLEYCGPALIDASLVPWTDESLGHAGR